MTDNEVRQLMIAFARLETKFDGLKEDLDELKDWRDKLVMIVISTVIVAGITVLLGTGVVKIP